MTQFTDTQKKWNKISQDQVASGQSVKKYCAENSLSLSTFYYYKRRQKPSSTTKKLDSFITLKTKSPPQNPPDQIEIIVPNGIKINLPSNSDAKWLASFLRCLS